MIAGQLEVQMYANLVRLQNDMNEAKRMVGGTMDNISSAVGAAKYALGALGIGLSVNYFVNMIQGSIDAADHLNDLTKITNLTIEEMSGFDLLARQSGTDLDSLAKSVAKMSVEMGKSPEKFRELGITATSNKEALMQFADVFAGLADINQRNALSQSVFSKSWEQIAPVLSEGGRKIGEAIDNGARLSGQTKENGIQADRFNDALAELNISIGRTGKALSNELLRGMIVTIDELNKLTASGNNFLPVGGAISTVFETLVVLGANTGYVFHQVGAEIGGIGAQLAALSHGDFEGFSNIGMMMKEDAERARKEIDAFSERMLAVKQLEVAKEQESAAAVAGQKREQEAAAAKAAAFLEYEKRLAAAKAVAAQAAKQQADQEKELRSAALEAQAIYFDLDPIAKATDYWEHLLELKQRGLITEEKIGQAYYMTYVKAEQAAIASLKAAEKSSKAWEEFTSNVQRNLGDVLYNGMNGKFNGIADLFKQMLMRMAADAAAANLTQSLFGNGSGSGYTSMAASIMGAFSGGGQNYGSGISESAWMAQASYAGGGYTGSGSRSGGVDGMGGFPAILHPNETVIDHASGQSGGTVVYLTYAPSTHIDARSDQAQVRQIADSAARHHSAELVDRLQRQGQLA